MKAIILVAGYGTRLYPLTINTPKALLEIKGKPIIQYIVDNINNISEVNKIYVVSNAKFYNNFVEWSAKAKKIKILNDGTRNEDERIGALGDLQLVIDSEKIVDDLLVIHGDNLFDFNLQELVNFFRLKKSTVVVAQKLSDKERIKKLGALGIDKSNRVIEFVEKPKDPGNMLASTGVYIYPIDVIEELRDYIREGGNKEGSGFFLEWLHKRREVYAFLVKGKWYDIGNPETLEEARRNF